MAALEQDEETLVGAIFKMRPNFLLVSFATLFLALPVFGCTPKREAIKNSLDSEFELPEGVQDAKQAESNSPKELDTIPDASEVEALNK